MPAHFIFLECINHFQWRLWIMKLVLNMGKSKIVKFIPWNFSYFSLHITFAEHMPVGTNAMKSLVLQVDSQISWMPHISYLLHKLISVCYMMRKLSHVLNIQALRSVNIENFQSLVNYKIIFWGNNSSVRKIFLTKKNITNYAGNYFKKFLQEMF